MDPINNLTDAGNMLNFSAYAILEVVMSMKPILICLVMFCGATPGFSQGMNSGLDCKDPTQKESVECICAGDKNANKDECLALPPPTREATNFIGLIGPALGGFGVIGALAGAAGGTTTTTTTATTSTY